MRPGRARCGATDYLASVPTIGGDGIRGVPYGAEVMLPFVRPIRTPLRPFRSTLPDSRIASTGDRSYGRCYLRSIGSGSVAGMLAGSASRGCRGCRERSGVRWFVARSQRWANRESDRPPLGDRSGKVSGDQETRHETGRPKDLSSPIARMRTTRASGCVEPLSKFTVCPAHGAGCLESTATKAYAMTDRASRAYTVRSEAVPGRSFAGVRR